MSNILFLKGRAWHTLFLQPSQQYLGRSWKWFSLANGLLLPCTIVCFITTNRNQWTQHLEKVFCSNLTPLLFYLFIKMRKSFGFCLRDFLSKVGLWLHPAGNCNAPTFQEAKVFREGGSSLIGRALTNERAALAASRPRNHSTSSA